MIWYTRGTLGWQVLAEGVHVMYIKKIYKDATLRLELNNQKQIRFVSVNNIQLSIKYQI